MHNQKRILLIVTGHTIEPVRSMFQNTEAHFANAIGNAGQLHPYAICEDWPTKPTPNLSEFDGVIMTGSASMVGDNSPWIQESKKLVEQCIRDEIPFLGVCFGHQILGAVCGAKVGPNPSGRANGSRLVNLTQEAPIFNGLPSSFWAQISHRDVVLENRPEFNVIATAPHDARHAIEVGKTAFGVQFHPEWDIHISRAYIDARQEVLGEAVANAMRATLTESPVAGLILKRFVEELA